MDKLQELENTIASIGQIFRATTGTKPRIVQLGNGEVPAVVKVPAAKARYKNACYVFSNTEGTINVEQAVNGCALLPFPENCAYDYVIVEYPPNSTILTITRLPSDLSGEFIGGSTTPLQTSLMQAAVAPSSRAADLRLYPTGTMYVGLSAGAYRIGETLVTVNQNATFLDVTSYVPSSADTAKFIHISIDVNRSPVITEGIEFDSDIDSEPEPGNYPPVMATAGAFGLGWVRLDNGMTATSEDNVIPYPDRNYVVDSAATDSSVIDLTITAGESLGMNEIIYIDPDDSKAYKIDQDADPIACSNIRGIAINAIDEDATGTMRIRGVVDGFAGLTAFASVYASSTAGGITQIRPSPAQGGSQIAFAQLGYAISTTEIMFNFSNPIQYMKRASMTDNAEMTVKHHNDALGRTRQAKAYLSSTTAATVLTGYASSNQDSDYPLQKTSDLKEKLAQSFQIASTDTIDQIQLWLKKVGSPTGTLTLRIETDSSGSPSGTLAHASATVTLAESSLGASYAWAVFNFASDFDLTGSTTYWIVLSSDRAISDVNYIDWGADNSAPAYTSGVGKTYASAVWSAPGTDFIFDVYTPGTTYEAELGRCSWNSDAFAQVEILYADTSLLNGDTRTSLRNRLNATADITLVVELP